MIISIDTNRDSYASWEDMQNFVEALYNRPVQPLKVGPGGKEEGTTRGSALW